MARRKTKDKEPTNDEALERIREQLQIIEKGYSIHTKCGGEVFDNYCYGCHAQLHGVISLQAGPSTMGRLYVQDVKALLKIIDGNYRREIMKGCSIKNDKSK